MLGAKAEFTTLHRHELAEEAVLWSPGTCRAAVGSVEMAHLIPLIFSFIMTTMLFAAFHSDQTPAKQRVTRIPGKAIPNFFISHIEDTLITRRAGDTEQEEAFY